MTEMTPAPAEAPCEWMTTPIGGFGRITQADDLLHPGDAAVDFTLTETYYFAFNIPERRLNGEIYVWMHRNLNTCTAGVWIWEGIKTHHLYSEHFNVHAHLPYPIQTGDTVSVPQVGLSIHIVEPLKRLAVEYRDPFSKTALDLRFEAIMPAAVRGNNKHFEQAMRATGTLLLGDERLLVDCHTVRDRSWGQPRREHPERHAPIQWSVGVVDRGNIAFNLLTSDDPRHRPEWRGIYDIPADKMLRDGWIWIDGGLRRIARASQSTDRDAGNNQCPTAFTTTFVDDRGADYILKGSVVATCPWGVWPNLFSSFNLVRWDLNGHVGYGDEQETFWSDFLRRVK